jgi:hypothetical protein
VRRGLEPRAPTDAAAREQSDVLGAEKPGRSLGRIARVGVLREEHDEAALELGVQRGKDERERRLGDASARPAAVSGLDRELAARLAELAEECLKPLVCSEFFSKRVQHRPVHDERRNRQVPGCEWYAASGP